MSMDKQTIDPFVVIEDQQKDYIRYRNIETGKRWEVYGICDHRRDCLVGAIIDGILIETIKQAKSLPKPDLDCPVGSGFTHCCPLEIVEL